MPGPVFLETDRLSLRTMEEADVPFLTEMANDPRIRRPMFIRHKLPYTREAQREWVSEMNEREDALPLLLCEDGEPVGSMSLTDIEHEVGTGEVGYYVAPDAQGNGYATEGLTALVRYAFDALRLHKVTARTYEHNEASQAVLEKVGFQREGRHRDEGFLDGEYRDVVYYGLLADELHR